MATPSTTLEIGGADERNSNRQRETQKHHMRKRNPITLSKNLDPNLIFTIK